MMNSIDISLWWFGMFTYTLCHVFHIGVWRLFPPLRTVKTLVLLFILVPAAVYLFGIAITQRLSSFGIAYLVHFALAGQYIAVYPACQASSPTILILWQLFRRKNRASGMDKEALLSQFRTSDSVLEDRISDLETANLAKQTNGVLSLTRKGRFLATLFLVYRRWIGLPLGEG